MSDDKKIIFSMVGVSKVTPQGKQIIKNIYLSFFYGAKIGIIGLNGSGKSTVMKIIAGLDKSFQGDVVFSPGYSVGYLPQEPELDPNKTVRDIVLEGAQEIVDVLAEYEEINNAFMDEDVMSDPDKMDKLIARQGEVQDKIDALDAWELDTKIERAMDALRCPPDEQLIGTLSGGERQSVAIARSVYFGAKVLILDEPTSALGVRQSGIVLKYVLAAKDRGVSVVFITHNPHHAYLVGDRFYLLNRGQLLNAFERKNVKLEELTKAMAGGAELETLTHEINVVRGK